MKTKITLLIVLFVTINISAQINKYNAKKVVKIAAQNVTLKLQLLKATKAMNLPKEANVKFNEPPKPLTQFNLTPGAYAEYSTALNVSLNPSNVKVKNAYLRFNGEYDGEKIFIRRMAKDYLRIRTRVVKNKTYRVKVNFQYGSGNAGICTRNFTMDVDLFGSTEKAVFKVKEGLNEIEFLVQSTRTGWNLIKLFGPYSMKCDGKPEIIQGIFSLNNVSIRQLKD